MTVSNSDDQEAIGRRKELEQEVENVWHAGIFEFYQSAANLFYQIGYRDVFNDSSYSFRLEEETLSTLRYL
jgi:hypothetical protein